MLGSGVFSVVLLWGRSGSWWAGGVLRCAVVLRAAMRAKVRGFVLGFLLLLQTLEARRRPKPRHL